MDAVQSDHGDQQLDTFTAVLMGKGQPWVAKNPVTATRLYSGQVGIKAVDGEHGRHFTRSGGFSERSYKEEFGADFAQAILGHKSAQMSAGYDGVRGGWN